MGWQLGVHQSVLIEILNSTQVRHLDVFIDFLISHLNAHLSYTRTAKDLCDVVRVDQNSALTSVSANEILSIAKITAVRWCIRREPSLLLGTILPEDPWFKVLIFKHREPCNVAHAK